MVNSGNPIIARFNGKNTTITVGFNVSGQYQPNKLLDVMIKALQASKQVTILESGELTYFGYIEGYRLVELFDASKNITSICYLYSRSVTF